MPATQNGTPRAGRQGMAQSHSAVQTPAASVRTSYQATFASVDFSQVPAERVKALPEEQRSFAAKQHLIAYQLARESEEHLEVGQRAGKRGGGDTHLISGVYALARCLVATGGWFAMSARMPATMRDALAFINREYNREQVSAGRTLVRWEGGAVLLLMKCLLEAYLTGFGFLHADAPEGLPHWEEAAAKAAAASLAKMGDLRDDNAHVYEARALAAGGDVSSLPPDVALAFQFQSHGVSPGVVRQALMLVLCRINKSLSTHWSHRHREPGADSKRLAYDRAWLETAVRWCQEVPDSHWASWCLAEGAASLYGPGHISQRFMHAALERAQAAGDDLTAALAAWNLALCTVFSTPDEPRTFSPAAVGRLTAAAEGYEGLLDSWGGLELARPRLQLVRQSVKAGVEAAKLAEEEAKAEARGNGAASEAGAAGAADGSLPPLGSGGTGTAAAGDTPAQDSELPCVSNFRLLKTGGPNVKPLRHCDGCGRHFAKVRGCSSCCVRHYCSKECQVRDWERRHQDECAVLAAVVPRSGPAFDGVVEAAGAAVAAAAAAAAPPAEPEACESPEAASGRHRGRSPQRHASSHKAGAVRRSQASDGGAAAAGAGGARAMPTHSGASSTASSVRGDSSVRGATNASRGVASRSSLEADSLAARTRGLRVSGGAK